MSLRLSCLLLLALALPVAAQEAPAAATEEAAQVEAIDRAAVLLRDGHLDEGIAILDRSIAYYEAKYPEGDTRWYVSRDAQESLAYMLMAAADADAGKAAKPKSQALIVQWSTAWFLKGYAAIEAGKADDARVALDRAIALSPWNSRFLNERGILAKSEKKWEEALHLFEAAADHATFSGETADDDRSRALRGQAFVLIEMGDLDRAEKALKSVLEFAPDDEKAKQELEYIAQVRAANKK